MIVTRKMTRHSIAQQLSPSVNIVTIVLTFWHIGINDCLQVTLENKQPSIEKNITIGMINSIRVERGIYQGLDRRVDLNETSDIYFPQNWSFVQTINDTTTNSGTLSNDKKHTIEDSFRLEDYEMEETKDEISNMQRETRDVFEQGHTQNLCYLCDVCTDSGVCDTSGLNISIRHKGIKK